MTWKENYICGITQYIRYILLLLQRSQDKPTDPLDGSVKPTVASNSTWGAWLKILDRSGPRRFWAVQSGWCESCLLGCWGRDCIIASPALRWRCVRAGSTPFNESFHLTSDRRYQIDGTNHFYINIWSERKKKYISYLSTGICHVAQGLPWRGQTIRGGLVRAVRWWVGGHAGLFPCSLLGGMLVFLNLCLTSPLLLCPIQTLMWNTALRSIWFT